MKTGYKNSNPTKGMMKGYDMPEMKPTVSIPSELLPAVKDWKVGSEYSVTLKLKQTGLHEKYGEGGLCADFEILDAKEAKGAA